MKQRPLLDQADSLLGSKAAQTGHVTMTVEQEALMGPSGERPWLITALLLVGLILGLFGFTRLTTARPHFVSSSVSSPPSGQPDPTVEPAPSALIRPDAEVEDTVRPENADLVITPDRNVNERVVRRFYDEVLNQGYELAMPYLFARQVTYQACDETPMTFSTVEFTQSLLAEQRRFRDLDYAIKHVIVEGDRVSIGWSVEGRPIDPLAIDPASGEKLTWSGLTVWQIANGKIVAGRSSDTGSLCHTQ